MGFADLVLNVAPDCVAGSLRICAVNCARLGSRALSASLAALGFTDATAGATHAYSSHIHSVFSRQRARRLASRARHTRGAAQWRDGPNTSVGRGKTARGLNKVDGRNLRSKEKMVADARV